MGKEIFRNEIDGVAVEHNGKYWGVQYSDGHCTCKDYGPIENAEISDPKYCQAPIDLTWNPSNTGGFNREYESLGKGVLVPIKKILIYEKIC